VLATVFEPADRDGDGKLTRAELEAFFDLIESGVACRVVVTVVDRGRNLFDRFDANDDGRLDLGELTRAAKVGPEPVPASYRLSVGVGSVGEAFGPVPLGVIAKPKPAAKSALAGPRWFQAKDRNADGYVSANEFLGTPELFTRLDTDRDGRISPEEAKTAK
jgi:Ca2+-binding EF-hand superfamily protein